MKKLIIILTAGLFAVTALQAANIPISSLPFAITAPGTYVVTGNLTFSPLSGIAITVSTALAGPVVIDLRGFTLTGSGSANQTVGVGIGFDANTSVPNAYPITIRNGTLLNFGFGVRAELDGIGIDITNLTVNKLTFTVQPPDVGTGHAVTFRQVSSSTVNNCTFNSGNVGISDQESKGGNTYNNNIFNKCNGPLVIEDSQFLILSRCQFEAPVAP
jgi:hypothetical protein